MQKKIGDCSTPPRSSPIALSKGELEALIDYHDQNAAGAEAMGFEGAMKYHDYRGAELKKLRKEMPE